VLADVGNRTKVRQVFEKYRPDVVFHSAAYKHVPLLEANPLEAVRNNVLATKTVADVAVEFETQRFVLVSTDKAAQPKNLLGQSKAVGEWIVQAYGSSAVSTRFVAVRFGNVLGSSGSVIPTFRKQIERGGPVTVTHREMRRYFMTIPESVSLIVQAASMGGRGHVYVLDMGEPVSIYELAENMIRLSGKVPERDIPIRITGVRPGEKLHEVLWNEGELAEPTAHPKILAASQAPIDPAWLDAQLRELEYLVEGGETLELVATMTAMFREPQRVGARALEDTLH
jgi:FlaA1/EpsC-like NDP-sugar epimerase